MFQLLKIDIPLTAIVHVRMVVMKKQC